MKKGLVIFFALLTYLSAVNPIFAKSVSFDVQHTPDKKQYALNKPYFIDARKTIEARWEAADPKVGKTVRVIFTIEENGQLKDIDIAPNSAPPVTLEERQALLCAASAIDNASPFAPLPNGQQEVSVIATFKSDARLASGKRLDTNGIAKAVEFTAFAALVGFSIYALCKWGGTSSVNNRFPSTYIPSGEDHCTGNMSCNRCTNCHACKHCNAGLPPCGVWHRFH